MNSAPKHRLDLLTHGQALERLSARPAVILPLGGCEPFGGAGPLGLETLCASRISGELSERLGVLSAPALPFGCSTPFASFPGAAGVKPRTMVNALCEIVRAYALQGAANVFLVSAAPFNKAAAGEAAKRIEAKGGAKVWVFDVNAIAADVVCAIDNVGNVDNVGKVGVDNGDNGDKGGKGDKGDKGGIDRADAALLAMAAYFNQESVSIDTSGISGIDTLGVNNINTIGINPNRRKSVSPDQYRTWKKRGADPQKLRKLFPDGLLLPRAGKDASTTIDITPERGRVIFEGVVGGIEGKIKDIMGK